MRRVLVALLLAGAVWMGLTTEAQAQVQIMPTGPLSLKSSQDPLPAPAELAIAEFPECFSNVDKVYPGRTMGGGSRMLRPNPPPSFLRRPKE